VQLFRNSAARASGKPTPRVSETTWQYTYLIIGGEAMRKSFSVAFSAVLLLIVSAQLTWAQKHKVWELGTYPGGTWAELQCINDLGVAMGWGEVPIGGGTETRMIGIPLFGFNAGRWFESGVSSGENDAGEEGGISNTGILVGNIMGSNGWPEAYAWTPNHAGVHLGKYSDDDGSVAIAINHSGTLIVGMSGKLLPDQTMRVTPIVWMSKVIWNNGRPTLSWEMHALPTGGLEKPGAVFDGITLNFWGGWGVNDLGQIAGDGWTSNEIGQYWEIAVVWNPIKGGKEWEIQRLPMAADFAYNEALAINDLGEIVGNVWGADRHPALWKRDSRRGNTWNLAILPLLHPTDIWDTAWGINDLGDIVGFCFDPDWVPQATRWNAHAPLSPAQALGFPGDWSVAYSVNNLGIAVGGYGIGDGPEQAVAMKLH
jgi:uncharacterized membrane protein